MKPSAEIPIRTEPTGDAYRALVDALVGRAAQFLLVVRGGLSLSPAGRRILEDLEPFKLRVERRQKWPGTKTKGRLKGRPTRVSYYHCSPESADVLKRSSPGLYSWEQPDHPEDLCFLDQNGDVLLATVAHEELGWVRSGPVAQAVRSALGDEYLGTDEADA